MRVLIEIYRWVTIAAFVASAMILAIPLLFLLVTRTGIGELSGVSYIGVVLLGMTFAVSGLNVIGIAIYDQLRALTTEAEYARTEIAYLREELRGR